MKGIGRLVSIYSSAETVTEVVSEGGEDRVLVV